MSKRTFWGVMAPPVSDTHVPVNSGEFTNTTWKFFALTLAGGLTFALAVLGLSYVALEPALGWLVPFTAVILALGAWLSFVAATQFLNMQHVMMESFVQWRAWQETQRDLVMQSTHVQTNTSIQVSGEGNLVAFNNMPQVMPVQEHVRLVPVHTPSKLIDGIPAPTLAFFIDQYNVRGWGQRAWVDQGIRLPGLKEPVNYDIWRMLVGELEKIEGIPPVKPRTKIQPILPLETIKHKLIDG